MSDPTPARAEELAERLAAGAISFEQFLMEAREAGIDRREAAQLAVSSAATETPGGRSVGSPKQAAQLDSGTSHVHGGAAGGNDGVARVGLWTAVEGLDPAIATYRTSRLLTEQLYSTLMALGPDGRPYPDLAEWIEVSDDAQTYTFGIVRGVRFHDGSELTAEDVAFSLNRIREMGEDYHFEPWTVTMDGAEAIDPLTVRLHLTQPTGPILTWLAFCGTGIVPRAAVESGRDLNREPIGSGPFRLAEPWPGGDAPVKLERHDRTARGGAPFTARLAGLEYSIIPDEGARSAALLEGRIDLDALLAPAAFDRVAATPRFLAHETPDSRWHWLVVNCRHPLLGDVRVRQAIAVALDRTELLEPFAGHGTPIQAGVIAPWSWAAWTGSKGFPVRGDPAAARALLVEAKVPPDAPLEILASENLPVARRQAELIAAQLQRVGLGARVKVVDAAAYAAAVVRDGPFELATSYWGSPIWDPDDFVYMGFRSGARYDAGSCSSPAMDALMDAGRASIDQAVRADAYRRLQALAVEQLPVVPTIQPAMLRGTIARLRGYVPTPCAQLRTLRDAWLED